MRLGAVLISAVAMMGVWIATQGCSGSTATNEDNLCTPGAYVFCKCADKAEGTKLCKDDGQSFEKCTTSASGECVGGEIPDPKTGDPVNPPDDVVEPDDDAGTTPANPLNGCPGKSQALTPGADIKLEGDTKTATGDRKGKTGACAVGTGANDHVYHLIPSGTGSLEVKVQGVDGLDPLAYVRTTCEDAETQAACAPPLQTKLVTMKLNVATGKDYYLFIDGASGTAGKYVANLKLTTGSFCGDGQVDSNEACDDGNKTEDDGCSNDCKKVNGNPTSGGACPGHPVHVWAGQTVTGTGSTNPYGNTWNAPSSSSCSIDTTGTNTYQDHVYEVTPHASGNLVVTVSAPPTGTLPNFMISARRACTTVGTDKTLCKNDASIGGSETLTVPVTNGQPLFVAIDGGGVSSNKGDYSISFKVQ